MIERPRKLFSILSVLLFISVLSSTVVSQVIRTEHELNGFTEYTSYDNLIKFLYEVKETSTEMQIGFYGKTELGRDLPYAVFSRPAVSKPWEALSSGKPIVVLNSNVHGGERTLRESNLMLIRELADPNSDSNRLLDDIIVIMVPTVNPDGFDAQPRATRGNSHGIDLNRDYMKLEQPALANFVQNILLTWHPHVVVDGHNGGSFPYNICYQGPSNASPDQRITLLCDREIFPFIDSKMEADGYRSWYYSGGDRESWRGGGSDPRIGRNYGGFINTVGILFESPGGQEREIGALSGKVAYKAVLQYVAANPENVIMHVERARRETVEMGKNARSDIVVQMEYAPEDYKVDYLIGEGPRGGEQTIVEVKGADLIKKPVPTKVRPRPYAYILYGSASKAVDMLKRHKINIEVLEEDIELEVQVYALDSVSYAQEYDHPAAATVYVGEVRTQRIMFPKGSYVIQTGQYQGRVAAHMLEPETNDNVVRWNTMDFVLPARMSPERLRSMNERRRAQGQEPVENQRTEFPIFKLMTSMPLPTKILNY
ncbi:M14 family zinc carboxypeptidase [candidate division KSB1 bacterium]